MARGPSISEAAAAARAEHERVEFIRSARPGRLLELAEEVMEQCGAGQVDISGRTDWIRAAMAAIDLCVTMGWNPRTYVRVQAMRMAGFVNRLRAKGRDLTLWPQMLVSRKAIETFRKRPGCMRDDTLSPWYERMLRAESLFGMRYVDPACFDCSAGEIEREVRRRPEMRDWSLTTTAKLHGLRMRALASAATDLDIRMPKRVVAPAEGWTWPSERRRLHGEWRALKRETLEKLEKSISDARPGQDMNHLRREVTNLRVDLGLDEEEVEEEYDLDPSLGSLLSRK